MTALLSHRAGEILVLTLNRPAAANALDGPLQDALGAALAEGAGNDAVRATVLAAAGDRVFSAGADLKEFAELDRQIAGSRRRAALLRTFLAIVDFPKPLVAAVQGKAIGAGCMLPLLADEVVAADTAELRLPEIGLGMPSPLGFSVLASRAGGAAARRLVQLGEPVGAAGAHALGLVDMVVDAAELGALALERARALAVQAGYAYRANKAWINREIRLALEQATAEAERLQEALHGGSGRTTDAD